MYKQFQYSCCYDGTEDSFFHFMRKLYVKREKSDICHSFYQCCQSTDFDVFIYVEQGTSFAARYFWFMRCCRLHQRKAKTIYRYGIMSLSSWSLHIWISPRQKPTYSIVSQFDAWKFVAASEQCCSIIMRGVVETETAICHSMGNMSISLLDIPQLPALSGYNQSLH